MLLLGAWIAHRLATARDRRKLVDDARSRFHLAFSEALGALSRGDTDAFTLLSNAKSQHDAAIVAFRPFVRKSQIPRFEAATHHFHDIRAQVNPGLTVFYERQATGLVERNVPNREITAAINELLSFAEIS